MAAAHDGGDAAAHLMRAARDVVSAISSRQCSVAGREAAAAQITQSASLLRALKSRELCETALSAVALLLPALAGVTLPHDPDPDDSGAAEGCGEGSIASTSLWSMRASVAPPEPECELSVRAQHLVWEGVGPAVIAQVEANRWLLRYRAARCVLIHDAISSLQSPRAETVGIEATKGLLCVARLSQDPRAPLRQLGLLAAAATILSSASCRLEGVRVDRKTRRRGALAWLHIAQLVEDFDNASAVAHAARMLLSGSGYPTDDHLGNVIATHESSSGASHAQCPDQIQEASSHLADIGASRMLPLLVRSLGVLSPSRHCGVTWQGEEGGEGATDEEEEEEEEIWLRHELEMQSVPARLKAIETMLIALRRPQHAGVSRSDWSIRQEIALLTDLRMAKGRLPRRHPAATCAHRQTACAHRLTDRQTQTHTDTTHTR